MSVILRPARESERVRLGSQAADLALMFMVPKYIDADRHVSDEPTDLRDDFYRRSVHR